MDFFTLLVECRLFFQGLNQRAVASLGVGGDDDDDDDDDDEQDERQIFVDGMSCSGVV